MTKDSKIALVISATLLCLFIGWEWPIAWLLLIGGIVVLTQLPTKPTRMRQRDGADRTNTFIDEQTGPGISPDITRITQLMLLVQEVEVLSKYCQQIICISGSGSQLLLPSR